MTIWANYVGEKKKAQTPNWVLLGLHDCVYDIENNVTHINLVDVSFGGRWIAIEMLYEAKKNTYRKRE